LSNKKNVPVPSTESKKLVRKTKANEASKTPISIPISFFDEKKKHGARRKVATTSMAMLLPASFRLTS
jgi:hypothetical protein